MFFSLTMKWFFPKGDRKKQRKEGKGNEKEMTMFKKGMKRERQGPKRGRKGNENGMKRENQLLVQTASVDLHTALQT